MSSFFLFSFFLKKKLLKLYFIEHGCPLLLQYGGVAAVMRALRHHQTHDIICERGFQILQSLASGLFSLSLFLNIINVPLQI